MNTNNSDILFFVRREYGAPSIELRAYKVEKVNNEFAFLELERLRLVVFSGDFQSVSLHHEYGKNNCMYNSANNIPDLMKDMKRWQLSPIDRRYPAGQGDYDLSASAPATERCRQAHRGRRGHLPD